MNKVSFNDPWHAVSFIYFFHECAQTEKVIFFVESAAQVLVRIYHVMENAFVYNWYLVSTTCFVANDTDLVCTYTKNESVM